MVMEKDEPESMTIETIEMAGDIVDEPILSKSIRELKLGSKHRKINVGPFFCQCGKVITKENATRCSHCKRLICKDCCVLYLNETHCKKCLESDHEISLTKPDYMILDCISNGVTDAGTIFLLTGIKPDVVKNRINDWMEKYVTMQPKGLLERIFPKLRVTNLGRDALGVFDAIYSKDADCVTMKQKLQEFLTKQASQTYSLRTEEDVPCSNQKS
jgi:hypothetical protein